MQRGKRSTAVQSPKGEKKALQQETATHCSSCTYPAPRSSLEDASRAGDRRGYVIAMEKARAAGRRWGCGGRTLLLWLSGKAEEPPSSAARRNAAVSLCPQVVLARCGEPACCRLPACLPLLLLHNFSDGVWQCPQGVRAPWPQAAALPGWRKRAEPACECTAGTLVCAGVCICKGPQLRFAGGSDALVVGEGPS